MDAESHNPEVVIFFDANMSHMDKCGVNCADKKLVLCAHKLNFAAKLIYPGRAIDGLNDYQVLKHFFNLICRQYQNIQPRPLFVLVTKDHDFLPDANLEYKRDTQKDRPIVDFYKYDVKSEGCQIKVVFIEHKNYGQNHLDDLHRMIEKLNELYPSRRNS